VGEVGGHDDAQGLRAELLEPQPQGEGLDPLSWARSTMKRALSTSTPWRRSEATMSAEFTWVGLRATNFSRRSLVRSRERSVAGREATVARVSAPASPPKMRARSMVFPFDLRGAVPGVAEWGEWCCLDRQK